MIPETIVVSTRHPKSRVLRGKKANVSNSEELIGPGAHEDSEWEMTGTSGSTGSF